MFYFCDLFLFGFFSCACFFSMCAFLPFIFHVFDGVGEGVREGLIKALPYSVIFNYRSLGLCLFAPLLGGLLGGWHRWLLDLPVRTDTIWCRSGFLRVSLDLC